MWKVNLCTVDITSWHEGKSCLWMSSWSETDTLTQFMKHQRVDPVKLRSCCRRCRAGGEDRTSSQPIWCLFQSSHTLRALLSEWVLRRFSQEEKKCFISPRVLLLNDACEGGREKAGRVSFCPQCCFFVCFNLYNALVTDTLQGSGWGAGQEISWWIFKSNRRHSHFTSQKSFIFNNRMWC